MRKKTVFFFVFFLEVPREEVNSGTWDWPIPLPSSQSRIQKTWKCPIPFQKKKVSLLCKVFLYAQFVCMIFTFQQEAVK